MQEVEAAAGIPRSTIDALRAKGKFPQPVVIGVRGIRFRESEIAKWIAGLERAK